MSNTRTASLMILGAVLVGMAAVGSGTIAAYATVASSANAIIVEDSVVPLMGSTAVLLCAGDAPIVVISAALVGPDSGVDATISAVTPLVIAPDSCNEWDVPGDFGTTLENPGSHAVLIGQESGPTFFADFAVSFMVIPESPIGIAALMGASLAALGAFVGIKHRRAAKI